MRLFCYLLVLKKNNSTSKPREDLVSAKDLNRKKASSNSYNCYGNAIGKEIITYPTSYKVGDSTRKTFEAVKKDIGKSNIRELNSINDFISDDENLVALKCGPFDYHFMVRVDGIWYNKPGTTPLIENENYLNVISKVWKGRYINKNGNIKNDDSIYYDVTIYFAIKKDWDK